MKKPMTYLRPGWIASMVFALAACGHGEAPHETMSKAEAAAPASVATSSPIALADPAHSGNPLDLARMEGFGETRFGMDLAAFKASWGGELKSYGKVDPLACQFLFPFASKARPDVEFMFEGGRFVRYDVHRVDELAPGGGRIGMTRDALVALYPGKAEVRPDKYDPEGSTVKVPATDGRAIVFDVGKDGKVTGWRVGIAPQIDYVERCG